MVFYNVPGIHKHLLLALFTAHFFRPIRTYLYYNGHVSDYQYIMLLTTKPTQSSNITLVHLDINNGTYGSSQITTNIQDYYRNRLSICHENLDQM